MIKEMSKLQIVGPKSLLDECIRLLHAMAVVHLETVPLDLVKARGVLRRLPLEKDKVEEREFLEKARERVKNLLFLLKAPVGFVPRSVSREEIEWLIEDIRPVEEEVKGIHARREALTEELASIRRYEKILRGFAPLISKMGGLKNFDILGLTIERRRHEIVSILEEEIKRITGGTYELYDSAIDDVTLGIILTYPRKFSGQIRHLILGEGINEIRLPEDYEEMSLLNAITTMVRREAGLPALVSEVDKELEGVSEKWYANVSGLIKAVEDGLDEIGVLTYCAQTRLCFVMEGWTPRDLTGSIRREFSKLFGDKVFVSELEVNKEEEDIVPVYIKNPQWLRPFEVFLKALPAPRYRSVDPTPYIALFFPVFFGLIVGDVGYGAVLFLLGLYLRRRFRKGEEKETLTDIATILSVCGVASIIFGVLFGELLGDLGERWGLLHPILFDRVKALKTFLVLTLGIGVGHVVLGLLIAIVNYIHRGKPREAVGKISYLVLIVAFLMILGIMFKYLPEGLTTPGLVALVLSFVILTTVEGITGPLEIIRVLGNILSYMRIMAVGTASVVMAIVANKVAGLSGSLIVGIIAAILIHTLNIFLSVLSPTIQSMRLQYVEFLSKFYEGGGRRYEPFKKR
jgi:V/A-type H+-transporting ATPase subunit I